ncbi:hypothetical protein LJB42_003586 [Komagataella kurtzmanii]|nr:hypothetical protein LJB42_003586 [Komagataella kurtzmanii]
MTDYSKVPINSLESLRLRLTQAMHSLNKLNDSIHQSQTLPQWSSIQNQLTVILSQLTSLSTTLETQREILQYINVYPLPEFPSTTHEGLLTTLLRKKNIPEVSEWITQSLEESKDKNPSASDQFATWCAETSAQESENWIFTGFRTKYEIDNDIPQAPEYSLGESTSTNVSQDEVSTDDLNKLIYMGIDPRKQ